MLSSRSVRTQQGKLQVEVAYPRSVVLSRLVRQLPWRMALGGALVGFFFSSWQHSSGRRPERGGEAMKALAGETALWGAAGGTAGLTGAVAYGLIGGPAGALVGLCGAALVGASTYSALPALAAMPRAMNGKTDENWALAAAAYTPVFGDDSIKNEAPPIAPTYVGPRNDRVLYLGMNSDSTEVAVGRLRRRADVTMITDGRLQDRITVGGKQYDLRNKKGIAQFAAQFGFNSGTTAKIRKAFENCEKDAKDELAQLALVWASGERGAHIPSRMVLAGHSNGDGVWGDNNGSLRLGPLLQLSRAFPHATAQIEDAMVTGCYSGGEVTMDQYLLIFPRAKTIWAYERQAPGVGTGATTDQAIWEETTRGRKAQFADLTTPTGKKFAMWVQGQYRAEKMLLTMVQLRGKVQWMEQHFLEPAFEGDDYALDNDGYRIPIRITDPHTGLVREYYSWLVRLTQNKQLPEDERPVWVAKKHQTIRLLYYTQTVAPRFASYYKSEIKAGYAKMGLPAPDYATLDRKDAVINIRRFTQKVEAKKNAPAESEELATLLKRGLEDLDPAIIPDGWV